MPRFPSPASLKTSEKVLATNTKTGKTEAETVTAVMVHHDTDLYDLTVKSSGRASVIHTTSNHLFWVPGSSGHWGRWMKAGALKYGTHLRTPGAGGTAVVTGGSAPADHDGWMWDITVPGDGDHDFYVDTDDTSVLVHNASCSVTDGGVYSLRDADGNIVRTGRTNNLARRATEHANDPELSDLEFNVEYVTNDYAEQRGLEQMVYDQNPQAMLKNGGFNKIRPISLLNPRRKKYLQAAQDFLDGL